MIIIEISYHHNISDNFGSLTTFLVGYLISLGALGCTNIFESKIEYILSTMPPHPYKPVCYRL